MNKLTQKELNVLIKRHGKWRRNEEGGERLVLIGYDLSGLDFSHTYLSWADLSNANLSGADLRWADLRWADLRQADLSGANIDFSAWPLWCGSRGVKVDMRIVYQLLAHVAVLDCDDPEYQEIKEIIIPHAIKSHRADDLGLKGE